MCVIEAADFLCQFGCGLPSALFVDRRVTFLCLFTLSMYYIKSSVVFRMDMNTPPRTFIEFTRVDGSSFCIERVYINETETTRLKRVLWFRMR